MDPDPDELTVLQISVEAVIEEVVDSDVIQLGVRCRALLLDDAEIRDEQGSGRIGADSHATDFGGAGVTQTD